MDSYVPGLFDRLMGDGGAAGGVAVRLSLEQLKDAVARDLEELLNTRVALPPGALDAYPECAASIVNYGLIDFAGMCLSSSDDRARICAALKAAIERHEPRLRNVRARLEREAGAINRVGFVISGTLAVRSGGEMVNFDAVLQPSSLRYSINRKGVAV
ncbi:type VI secretion system baseplate subunit TssE [Janthinobacterium sp. SUN128]|uniref:Type VI secretion system baseplate subunit TssE n=1 Tax=Janthinobacterium lividum TaxID=29581 RepID=A0AAJ4MQV6_9BURK|nr:MULTISPECIES: type VI secretion system baseplate subunit TssE [Janthinobacterium]KAB0326105.1 type VI secretion system baseplate subunit TssE [Janthinobacterium lividum]MDO8034381.1 type VI secretion system baseplate subunit TssE [Janthinobacterium sp. SUN128]QSX95232.1 type VI secretion system baseplate subunit TssE [Janthinobacterium lividum]UGQ35058.1 type VI secretion system baseplate subunit TssE [Janthinobacterium sp. PLB04]